MEDCETLVPTLPAKRKPPAVHIDVQISLYNALFPITDQPPPPDMTVFLDELPPYKRAVKLLDNYFKYFSWK
ncbi:MAG TPA: hypothetical protein VGO47_07635 [Chlamydiales bacterium]|nr:hypothetical protein [Chlamydiales bacterium]